MKEFLRTIEESLRSVPHYYSSIQTIPYNLLLNHFKIIYKQQKTMFAEELEYPFLIFSTHAAPLLLIATIYFHNTSGIKVLTIISAIVTFTSLLPLADITQSRIRIWLNTDYRRFLTSESWINSYWLIFTIVSVIGISWQYVQKFIINK